MTRMLVLGSKQLGRYLGLRYGPFGPLRSPHEALHFGSLEICEDITSGLRQGVDGCYQMVVIEVSALDTALRDALITFRGRRSTELVLALPATECDAGTEELIKAGFHAVLPQETPGSELDELLLTRLRLTSTVGTQTGMQGLSLRQFRILYGVGFGVSNGQIAEDLGMTTEEVAAAVEQLKALSGHADRTALAAWAFCHRLV